MSAPYTIEKTAEMSGLSVKYIRRLKGAMPRLFASHTDRGMNNSLLFNEEMIEILKRTGDMKNKGKTLSQIRNELMEISKREKGDSTDIQNNRSADSATRNPAHNAGNVSSNDSKTIQTNQKNIPVEEMLERENTMLKSHVELLKHLLKKAEDRFDRLLPEPGQTTGIKVGLSAEALAKAGQSGINVEQGTEIKKEGIKSQLLLWLVEAVVVTAFAAGFIFMIWLFAQRAFSL